MFDVLFAHYLNEFTINGEPVLKALINSDVPRKIVVERYERFPKEQRLETMSSKDKKELWEYVKELLPHGTKQQRLDAAKVVFTIGTLL